MFTKTLLTIAALAFAVTTYAHPVLPEQVMQYIWANPKASDEQIDAFLTKNPEYDIDDTRDMMTMLRDLTDEQLANIAAEGGDAFAQEGSKPSILAQLTTFIRQGIIHIIEGPDHVLFVLALLLIPMTLGQLLKVITTFTITHSITLVLAGLNLVRIPGSIVEPTIALSIAYIALSSVFLKTHHFANALHNKLIVVAGFGLFHGLGFASVFSDLQISSANFLLPLLGFNIGVEVGQLCIIGIALPILNEVRKLNHANLYIKITATLMSIAAIYWFIERVL